jgi:hypothetical protein
MARSHRRIFRRGCRSAGAARPSGGVAPEVRCSATLATWTQQWAWTGLGEARAPGQGSALRPGSDVPPPGSAHRRDPDGAPPPASLSGWKFRRGRRLSS